MRKSLGYKIKYDPNNKNIRRYLVNNKWVHRRHIPEIKEKLKKEDKEWRLKNIERFQTKDETRFLVGTPQTGGFGITLTAASTMIYYSNGYDLEKRTQSEARIDRIGQKFPMTYIDILAEDTVDERIVKALRKKINIATQVMGEELKDWI